jgi:ribosome-associated protein
MDIRKLQRAIVDGLEDVKAQNIAVFNTEHLSSLFERVIIASGTSNRQTKSLASSVREAVKGAGYPVPRMEGEANGEWIIVDCGAAVVHVMQPTIRDYYHLEEIWGSKPVRMKLGADKPLVKASAEEPAAKKISAKKVSAKKGVARPVALEKTVAKKAAAKKAPARKGPTPRRMPSSPIVTRVVGVKGAAARRPAAKKAASARPVAKKAAAPRRSSRG